MEQPEECKVTSRTFSDELSDVYESINRYRKRINANDKPVGKKKSKSLMIIVAVIALVIITVANFLTDKTSGEGTETLRLVLQLTVLCSYIVACAAIVFEFRSVKDFFKDFAGEIIGYAADQAKDEATLFEELDEFSTESIKYVANRLENSSKQLGQIPTFLLGAIEKVGIIPGLLATVIAISKVADSTGISWVEMLSFFMAGMYISMFPITEASMKIKRMSVLLEQYLVLFRECELPTELVK